MKVTIYVRPGDDPNEVAKRASAAIQSNLKLPCVVKVVGAPVSPTMAKQESTRGNKRLR